MSGHSHWATTKHAKAAADAKKGKIFSRIAKEIMLAAKVNGDPNTNPALRTLVEKGRKANMPKDNIENAIKKGTGELAGAAAFEEITYEGYAAGGVGIIVNVLTDNKNRAAADVGHIFKRNGSDFATRGAVSRNFERKGQILVAADAKIGETPVTEDMLMEIALEAGADDIRLPPRRGHHGRGERPRAGEGDPQVRRRARRERGRPERLPQRGHPGRADGAGRGLAAPVPSPAGARPDPGPRAAVFRGRAVARGGPPW